MYARTQDIQRLERRIEQLEALIRANHQEVLAAIFTTEEATMASLDDILNDVTNETTQIASLSTLISGLRTQVADAMNSGVTSPAVQAKVSAIFAAAEANKAALATALAANTAPAPAAPAASATPAPATTDTTAAPAEGNAVPVDTTAAPADTAAGDTTAAPAAEPTT